jgi:PAS domain S-box-containing protein
MSEPVEPANEFQKAQALLQQMAGASALPLIPEIGIPATSPDNTDPSLELKEAETLLHQMASAARLPDISRKTSRPIPNSGDPAHDQLWRAEQRYRALVEQIPVVTFLAALDFNIHELYVSPQIENLLGFSQDEWLSNPFLWYNQLYPDDRERWQKEFARTCVTGTHFRSEYRFIARDGRIVWVHGECQVIRDEQGAPLFLQGVAYDITESKTAEATLQRLRLDLEGEIRQRTGELANTNETLRAEIERRKGLEETLKQRAEQLADESKRKDQFLAMLAHELRNPLAPVLMAVDLLGRNNIEEEERTWALDMVGRQVKHMTRLIDDLLDISRISQGKIVLRRGLVDLNTTVQRAVDSVRPLITERRQHLTVELPEKPIMLDADSVRLEQIVTNLLTNAGKYTEPGGSIFLSAGVENEQPSLKVRDTGIGIPPQMLERIFDLFTQVDTSIARSTQWGLGIGLALVRGLVELHGGTVKAFSPGVGHGSEFVVHLPTCVTRPVVPVENLKGQDLAPGLPRRKILIVEDNAEFSRSMSLLLRSWGQDVRSAADGASALAAIPSHSPDVVLMDIGLPGMDGYEIARRVRQQPEGRNVFLVALTGYGRQEDRARATEAGFDYHLTKPIPAETLRQLLSEPPVRLREVHT